MSRSDLEHCHPAIATRQSIRMSTGARNGRTHKSHIHFTNHFSIYTAPHHNTCTHWLRVRVWKFVHHGAYQYSWQLVMLWSYDCASYTRTRTVTMAFHQTKPESAAGGYSCQFVEEPKELQTECSVCLQILCKPVMVSCCGEKFCHDCIEKIAKEEKPCPLCNQKFTTMADKKLERDLNCLKVYCTNKDEGCKWVGELKELNKHRYPNSYSAETTTGDSFEPEGCDYEMVQCTKCKEHIQRHKLENHLSGDCLNFVKECQFKYAGCKVKMALKDMESHIKENTALHLSLIMDLTHRLADDNVRINEQLAKISAELENDSLQEHSQQQPPRRELALKQKVGVALQGPHRSPWHCLGVWTCSSALLVLLFGILVAYRDPLIETIWREQLPHSHENFDFTEINLSIKELEDKVKEIPTLINKVEADLKHCCNTNTKMITTLQEDLNRNKREWSVVSDRVNDLESITEGLPNNIENRLEDLSNDVIDLRRKFNHLRTKEDIQSLQQKVDLLAGLQREFNSLKQKVDSLPLPLTRAEITLMVVAEIEARRPPHPPPHHHHHGHHGHHGHGGCRRHN